MYVYGICTNVYSKRDLHDSPERWVTEEEGDRAITAAVEHDNPLLLSMAQS